MTDTILLIGTGDMGRGYVTAAREMGLRVALVADAEWHAMYGDHVDGFWSPDGRTEAHWLTAALDAAEACAPGGALAFAEQHVLPAAWVQARHGLAGPSILAADASRNKAFQRQLFRRAGLPQPEFLIARNAEEAHEWSAGHFPVIVKALRRTAGLGVCWVASMDELGAELATRSFDDPLLVEEYLKGDLYSWEALIRDGEVLFGNYTKKLMSGPPDFTESGHILPHRRDLSAETDQLMAAMVRVLGIDTGLVHAEIIDDGERACLIEAAVRSPGCYIMELLGIAYRHDFFRSVIELALRRPVTLPATSPQAAGIVYFTAAEGRISRIAGAGEASQREDVTRVSMTRGTGDVIRHGPPLADTGGHIGYGIVKGASIDHVEATFAAVGPMVTAELAADETRSPAAGQTCECTAL